MKHKIALLVAIFTATTSFAELPKAPVITKPLPGSVPPCEDTGDGELYCQIHIEYLNSNNPTANRIVNTAINEYISPELAARARNADAIPSDSDYYPAIEQYIRDNSSPYSEAFLNTDIRSLDGYCGLAQYGVDIESYSAGGSIAFPTWRFAVDNNGQITPERLIIPGKQAELERLAEEALYQYLREENPDSSDPDFGIPRSGRQDISPYLYLAADGLHLQYQATELLSRSYGAPDLVLPWHWLNGIVDPRYLPENCL